MNKVLNLKGEYESRDVVILGNGPSLNDVDFSKFNNPIIIGLNSSILITKEKQIKNDFYVLTDTRFVSNKEKINHLNNFLERDIPLVIRAELVDLIPNDFEKNTYLIRSLGRDGFSFDLRKGFYFGCTTVMLALQLAVYIGGKNIYLCGVDLFYNKEKLRFYKESIPSEVDNFSCVQIHNIRSAFKQLKEKNVNVYLCSLNSLLRPYIPYYEL